jgi:DNA segregation ATPase FtsK/SpoIIIE-like protein
MLSVLRNISKDYFDKPLPKSLIRNPELFCISNDARKRMCNLFDATGSIANQRDYAAFQRKFPGIPAIREIPPAMHAQLRQSLLRNECCIVAIQQGVVLFPSQDQIFTLFFAFEKLFGSETTSRNNASEQKESRAYEQDVSTTTTAETRQQIRREILAETIFISPNASEDFTNKSIDETMETSDAESISDSEDASEERQPPSTRSSMLLEQFFSSQGSNESIVAQPNQSIQPNQLQKQTSGFWRFFGF